MSFITICIIGGVVVCQNWDWRGVPIETLHSFPGLLAIRWFKPLEVCTPWELEILNNLVSDSAILCIVLFVPTFLFKHAISSTHSLYNPFTKPREVPTLRRKHLFMDAPLHRICFASCPKMCRHKYHRQWGHPSQSHGLVVQQRWSWHDCMHLQTVREEGCALLICEVGNLRLKQMCTPRWSEFTRGVSQYSV